MLELHDRLAHCRAGRAQRPRGFGETAERDRFGEGVHCAELVHRLVPVRRQTGAGAVLYRQSEQTHREQLSQTTVDAMQSIIRKSEDRGSANFGWLDSKHSFSFGSYHDPQFMGFGPLRVINEDRVAPGGGISVPPAPRHGDHHLSARGRARARGQHRRASVIRPGDVQLMSAGTGVRHSEYNASGTDPVHFLQIWIIPERPVSRRATSRRPSPRRRNAENSVSLGSREGRDGSLTIHQDVDLYATALERGERVSLALRAGRGVWVQVADGGFPSTARRSAGETGLRSATPTKSKSKVSGGPKRWSSIWRYKRTRRVQSKLRPVLSAPVRAA